MNKPSLEEILRLSFITGSEQMYTAIPCIITNIPTNLQDLRVDVQPAIDRQYRDGTSEEHSQILGVPVVFPCGRTSMVSFPLFVGDTVLCVFSQRSLDNFKSGNGTRAIANDQRRMDSRDAIAIPGIVPFGKSLNNPSVRAWPHSTSDLVVAHNIATGSEVEIRMKPSGDLIINTNQNVTVNCNNAAVNAEQSISLSAPSMTVDVGTTTWSGTITQTGDYTQTGTYVLDSININTHKHTGVTPGSGTSGGPTN